MKYSTRFKYFRRPVGNICIICGRSVSAAADAKNSTSFYECGVRAWEHLTCEMPWPPDNDRYLPKC